MHRGVAWVFFFQAEDGIRDRNVTGVQTCALPICAPKKPPCAKPCSAGARTSPSISSCSPTGARPAKTSTSPTRWQRRPRAASSSPEARSEEHTSELQSRFDLVCRLLLEKKNQKQ